MVATEFDDKRHHLCANGRYVFLTCSSPSRYLFWVFSCIFHCSFRIPIRQFLYHPSISLPTVNFFTNNVSATNKVAM